jgi:hypothetical protein
MIRRPRRRADELRQGGQPRIEDPRVANARRDYRFDLVEQVGSDDRLERLRSLVDPPELDMVPIAQAVIAIQPEPLGNPVIVGDDDATVAHDVERFQRMHAECAHATVGAREPAIDLRADGRAGVLDDRDAMTGADVENTWQVRALARPIHGQQGLRFRRNRRLDLIGINLIALVRIDEHGPGANRRDGADCRDERVRDADHLVARAHAESLERQDECAGAGIGPDGVLHADVTGELALEAFHVRSKREFPAPYQFVDVTKNLLNLGLRELVVEIGILDPHHRRLHQRPP